MKTPREILLSKHQNLQPKLDLLRKQIVTDLERASAQRLGDGRPGRLESQGIGWLQFLRGFQWHLAGLSAVWVLIALLKFSNTGFETTPVAQARTEAPHTVIALLKQNRRQVAELGDGPLGSLPPSPPAPTKSRRSCIQSDRAYA